MSPIPVDLITDIHEVTNSISHDTFKVGGNDNLITNEDATPKGGVVSIDVTKALLLLGFNSWSELERGNIFRIISRHYM